MGKPAIKRFVETSCLGKFQYEDRTGAVKSIQSSNRRRKHAASALQPYRCSFCRYWHIGNKRNHGTP